MEARRATWTLSRFAQWSTHRLMWGSPESATASSKTAHCSGPFKASLSSSWSGAAKAVTPSRAKPALAFS